MVKVKIYGAGSIGNHLAYACRNKNWDVLICDVDPKALHRTKTDIYPARYGKWDDNIRLAALDKIADEKFDLVIIGTPPDIHIDLALRVLREESPRVILIEKPLCGPSLKGCDDLLKLANDKGTFVMVGYNHILTQNTLMAEKILEDRFLGAPLTIVAMFREHWGGIFKAHPWLSGPEDSYLGYSERGGGASGEHSHAINIWQHFAHLLNLGRIIEVSAMLDMVDDGKVKYDRICQLNVKTETGLVGNIVQDVVTEPAEKNLRIQGSSGFLEWYVNLNKTNDALRYGNVRGEVQEKLIPKNRPDDFKGEINHIMDIIEGKVVESPISLERGLETMLVVAAAHISHRNKKTVKINFETGYCLEAIE